MKQVFKQSQINLLNWNTHFQIGGISIDSCFLCSGGFFCDKDGQTIPEKQCAAGWFVKFSIRKSQLRKLQF